MEPKKNLPRKNHWQVLYFLKEKGSFTVKVWTGNEIYLPGNSMLEWVRWTLIQCIFEIVFILFLPCLSPEPPVVHRISKPWDQRRKSYKTHSKKRTNLILKICSDPVPFKLNVISGFNLAMTRLAYGMLHIKISNPGWTDCQSIQAGIFKMKRRPKWHNICKR